MSKIYDALQHLEAQRKAHTGGDAPEPSSNPLDLQERPVQAQRSNAGQPLLEQTAAVTRFGAELHRRMGEAGLDGLHGLFALADQLRRALGTVAATEIDTAEADLERVAEQVRTMQANLKDLKSVKLLLEGLSGR